MTIKTCYRPALAALAITAGAALAPAGLAHGGEHRADDVLHVTMTPTCGCCGAWVNLAEAHGFAVEITLTEDYLAMKEAGSVPDALWSCHTATIAGYTVEGHVPFDAIDRLLAERPAISGIAVPGMPAGSPGMGGEAGASYDVLAFGSDAGDKALFHAVRN